MWSAIFSFLTREHRWRRHHIYIRKFLFLPKNVSTRDGRNNVFIITTFLPAGPFTVNLGITELPIFRIGIETLQWEDPGEFGRSYTETNVREAYNILAAAGTNLFDTVEASVVDLKGVHFFSFGYVWSNSHVSNSFMATKACLLDNPSSEQLLGGVLKQRTAALPHPVIATSPGKMCELVWQIAYAMRALRCEWSHTKNASQAVAGDSVPNPWFLRCWKARIESTEAACQVSWVNAS